MGNIYSFLNKNNKNNKTSTRVPIVITPTYEPIYEQNNLPDQPNLEIHSSNLTPLIKTNQANYNKKIQNKTKKNKTIQNNINEPNRIIFIEPLGLCGQYINKIINFCTNIFK